MEPSSSTAAISLCQLSIATAVIRQGSLSFSCQKLRSCRIRQSSISSSCQKATDVIRQSQLSLSAVIWPQLSLVRVSCYLLVVKRLQLPSVEVSCSLLALKDHRCHQSRPTVSSSCRSVTTVTINCSLLAVTAVVSQCQLLTFSCQLR